MEKYISDCLFCKIVKEKEKLVAEREVYLVGENEEVIAILDKFPVSDGHTLLITKKHFPNIAKVDEKSWEYLLPLMKKIINKLKNTELPVLPQGFNIISNMNEDMEKKIAYQSISHLHIHIIPKYQKNQGFIWTVRNHDQVIEPFKIAEKLNKKIV